jgi:transposase
MQEKVRFLGLDVHADTISVAVAEPDGEVRSLGTIPNRAESIRRLVKKLGGVEHLRACYEAGPTGYVLYWQLSELGVTVRGGGADASSSQGRRPCEDRPAGCGKACA